MDRKIKDTLAQDARDRRKAAILDLFARPEVVAMVQVQHEQMLKAAGDRLGRAQAHLIAAE